MLTILHVGIARKLAEYRIRDLQREVRLRYPDEDGPGLARVESTPLARESRHRPEGQVTRSRDGAAQLPRRRGTAGAVRRSRAQEVDHGR